MNKDQTNERNKKINIDRGMAVNRLMSATDWHVMEEVKEELLRDLQDKLFMPAQKHIPLACEPTYAQIIAHRHGVVEGVKNFFDLLGSYGEVYLSSLKRNSEDEDD